MIDGAWRVTVPSGAELIDLANVLVISSFVARGYVGARASVLALERLGHEVTILPTVVLSNHPGHPRVATVPIPAERVAEMVGVYGHAGWLHTFDAVLTGYLPTAAHVRIAADAVRAVRVSRPECLYCCDPILGDDQAGLYVDPAAAAGIRDELVPLADIATPNRFELAWLTGAGTQCIADAAAAARALGVGMVLATSVPTFPERIATLLIDGDDGWKAESDRLDDVPHGTGDFLAGLYLGWRLRGLAPGDALARAAAGVRVAVAASAGEGELRLAATGQEWANAAPDTLEALPPRAGLA